MNHYWNWFHNWNWLYSCIVTIRYLIYHLLNLLACNTHVTELIIQHIHFFWMMNLFFICPLNKKANLTNEHCTSESVFVACAHIASVNNLLGVQIPHPSFLSHNFSFNPPFSVVTLVYPSLETQGLWVDFKSGWKRPFCPNLKSTHSLKKGIISWSNTKFSTLTSHNPVTWMTKI